VSGKLVLKKCAVFEFPDHLMPKVKERRGGRERVKYGCENDKKIAGANKGEGRTGLLGGVGPHNIIVGRVRRKRRNKLLLCFNQI